MKWLSVADVLALHERALRQDGGLPGLRDEGLLDSALQRPVNRYHYGDPDIYEMAAAYAYGLAMNHPFLDGNKRIALLSIRAFLFYNGQRFFPDEGGAVVMIRGLAAGEVTEDELAGWIRSNTKPRHEGA